MSDDQKPMAQVQASARGWHSIQLAVLGFVGICGVLKSGNGSQAPRGVEIVAGVLILVGLAVACWATYLVGRVAWPLSPPDAGSGASRRLRTGLTLTFVAVVLVSTAATASWWPTPEDASASGGFVRVGTSAGTLCGTLTEGGDGGSVRLLTEGRHIDIPLSGISTMDPAESCP